MTNYSGSGGGNTVGTSQFMYYHPYNAGGIASSSNALSLNTQQLITMVYDGTTFTMVRNGTQMSATAGAFAIQNATGATNFTMGLWNTGTIQNSGTTHFRMNEMLFYNRALSPNDRQTVEGYLAWKWALQGGLPLTHPYKYVSPSSNYPNSVIVPDGLYVNLTATAYSGSGTWSNIGALGTNNNASIYSGVTTKNAAGNGIVFNGTNVWAFPNVYNSELTLSVWYKRTATTIAVAETAILAQQISGNNTITMCFGVGSVTSNVRFARYSTAWTQATQTVGTTIGQWVHIVTAYTNSIVTTYSNAVSLGSTNVGGLGNGGQWFIGQNWNATTPMSGEVGQILIYNRALTAAEVLQNYTVTSNTFSV
jgi:hypothetical protein